MQPPLCRAGVLSLTIVRHAERQALLEAAVLALVAVFLLNLAAPITLLILKLHADCPSEETLWDRGCKDLGDQGSGGPSGI